MAGPNALSEKRYYLPTAELYETSTKFGNLTPAFNNNYDVWINFGTKSKRLLNFINQGSFYNKNGSNSNPGKYLALFCSEAVLPGSTLQTAQIKGLRQGVEQTYATFRTYPEIVLTWYSQKDYYTNEVFNNWMEFISPTRVRGGGHGRSSSNRKNEIASFRKMQYPYEYKVGMEITAFSKATTDNLDVLRKPNFYQIQEPSSITYYLEHAFPVNIVAAPLAYGNAELIKTSVTFKYDYYYIDRASRVGPVIRKSDEKTDTTRNVTIA